MKINTCKHTTRNVLNILVIITIALGISSCSQKASFMQSSVVPAADGKVKVKEDNNGNYKVEVDIEDLAEVERVYSNNYRYVVWMETDEGTTQNLGQLVSSKGFFSGQQKAKLETTTTFEPIQIFITAERERNPRYPGNEVVMRTRRF